MPRPTFPTGCPTGWLIACCLALMLAAPGSAARAAGSDRRVSVTVAGRPLLEIVMQGEAIRISGAPGEPVLLGVAHGADKRKYRIDGGALVAEVKLKPDLPGQEPAGFKVRAPDGKLLWKIKFADSKIKISADEEGARPWLISLKHPDKIKVLDGDGRELGAIKLRDRVVVEDAAGHDRFTATVDCMEPSKGSTPPAVGSGGGPACARRETGARSALLGVLLMEAIPARERWILMAEILAAGY